uniref:Uncharacterized protein n=2 Tax=Avena sativa TaxID=4498 RepID=A0ACD5WPG9_AVESA
MSTPAKRRTSISSSANALALTSTLTSSTNPVETSSSLPYFLPELIPLVAGRLTSLQDFFALRAACRTYRDLLPPSPSNLASQAPLLLVRHKASASEALFHAPLRRILRFRFPSTCIDRLTRFYSFGCCIATHDREDPRELRIRHLLTGEHASLPYPPEDFDGIIFSGDLVLTFQRFHDVLYFCRIGDGQWRAAVCDEGYLICSLLLVKGTLYGLIFPNYCLAVLEIHNDSVALSFLGDESNEESVGSIEYSMFWLAECRDELLLVLAVHYSPPVYHVFKWQSVERKWARTTTLGGCSLFLNTYQFAGCLGPDHPEVRRDCMYFTGGLGKWTEYSVVDGSWHDHVADYQGRVVTKSYRPPLVWVLPSIC